MPKTHESKIQITTLRQKNTHPRSTQDKTVCQPQNRPSAMNKNQNKFCIAILACKALLQKRYKIKAKKRTKQPMKQRTRQRTKNKEQGTKHKAQSKIQRNVDIAK